MKGEPQGDRAVAAAFVVEALLAGANAVAIRFSNRELAPLWGATLRFGLAALVMTAALAALRLPWPRGRALLGSVLFGLFQFAGAFGLFYWALVRLQAGLGQTILALVPLATLLLAVAQRQERLRGAAVVGTLLGLAGVGLISRGALGAAAPLASLLAVLGSVLCFAQALVIVRRFPPVHPVAMNAVGMAGGTAALFAASALAGEPRAIPQQLDTWLALGYMGLIGSVVVFLLHIYVVQRWTASRAAYVMVVIPLVAILLSAWLDNERVGAGLVAGGVVISAGVWVGALRAERAA